MASRLPRGARQDRLILEDQQEAPEHTMHVVDVRPKIFRMEASVSEAIRAGREGTPADVRWKAAETLARELARAIDGAARKPDPYAIAQLGPKLLDVLKELRLTPASAKAGGDLDELLADLSKPD